MHYAGTSRSECNTLPSVAVSQVGSLMQGSIESGQLVGHPDAALLILCGQLRTLQEKWQRLWAATPEVGEASPADAAWREFSDHVWPGASRQGADSVSDPVRGLIATKATTLEGMRAKAAAIKALDDAGAYLTSSRDDSYELMMSLLQDVAGPAVMPMGEDAEMEVAYASAD